MKKTTKIITIIASIMIITGILLTVIGYFSGAKLTLTRDGNGFKIYDSGNQISESFSLDPFSKIEGNLNDFDFEIIPSTEYKLEITRQEDQSITHKIKDHTLYLNEEASKGAIININLDFFSFPQSVIKLHVPKDAVFSAVELVSAYGDVHIADITSTNFTIEANNGDMDLNGINSDQLTITNRYGDIIADEIKGEQTKFISNDGSLSLKRLDVNTLNVTNNYGDIDAEDIMSYETTISMDNGDITLMNVDTTNLQISNHYGDMSGQSIDTEQLSLTLTDGDLTLNKVNANKAVINNQYGDLLLRQFNSQALDIQNNSGDVTLEGTLLGTSRVHAEYGDIQLILKNKQSELNYRIQSEFGDITVNNESFEGNVTQRADSNHQLNITAEDGDVNLQF